MDIVTLAAAMAYTKKTADALGAVKGAPCTIQGITDIEGGHRITFAWTSASGKVETSNLDVMNGEQGQQGEPGQPGAQGLPGNDGTSPAVTITDIPGGHRVTITDAAHPQGQSFDVMDGKDGGGGGTGGNADFEITTIPLGGSGTYEVNVLLSNNDSESVRALYSRGSNGEIPDWFSMQVASGLGTDNFHIATKEYADGLMSGKVDYVVIDVANFDMTMTEFENLFYSDKLIYIKDGYQTRLITQKYTWVLQPEVEYELSYIENNITVTYQFEITDDVYYRGRNVKPNGNNFEVGVEKWYGTYKENGVTYQVYSKLLDIGALPSAAGTTQYPHGITGIKQILQISGVTNDGFVMNAPRQNAQDNISIYQAQKSGNIVVEVGKDRSSKTGFVMLIYAKNN